ncbi:MAG: glycine cleavage system protein [Thermotogota bacterium]|nr:glycine cleavage system protein [Thermotogota bacterium]MDK2864736.1 glycine cleavage system protein [Thermotogota bacterium]
MKKFAKSHEWVEVEGKTAVVGISNHAQEELGDVVYVDLPEPGKEVKKGEVLCTIESVKAAADVYSPVSGKVLEVNKNLEEKPELVNESPESDGWLVKLEIVDESELSDLMDEEEYRKFCESEG